MYVITKSLRVRVSELTKDSGYRGFSCALAGVEEGKVYDDLVEAQRDCVKLMKVNPVGFVVHWIEPANEIVVDLVVEPTISHSDCRVSSEDERQKALKRLAGGNN